MSLYEGLVRFHRVGAVPDNLGIEFPVFLEVIPEGTYFFDTAQGIVLGVEEEYHRLTKKIVEPHHLSRLRGESETGSPCSYPYTAVHPKTNDPKIP